MRLNAIARFYRVTLAERSNDADRPASAVRGHRHPRCGDRTIVWHHRDVALPRDMAVLDFNIVVCGLLNDMASIQASMYARRAYERSARAVALLDRPLPEVPGEVLAGVPHLGKSALRIVREALATGTSATVEKAVKTSGRTEEVARRRSLREGFLSRAAARQVLQQKMTGVVGIADYRGDLQMHSQWSDGARTIAEMALACAERGYEHFAVTDHSRGLNIARGLSAEAMIAQHREIDALNDSLEGRLRMLKGVEANILADGTLDVTAEEMRRCDIVLAAPHSRLDEADDQTDRLMAVLKTPGVHVLAHPSGRKFDKRAGLNVRWGVVFKEAARRNIAIELDGDPSRQDLHYALVCQALDAGCLFAVDSDAHDAGELVFSEIALAHARLARIPSARVINCWPTKTLMAWLRKAATPSAARRSDRRAGPGARARGTRAGTRRT
jgi:histidinol phosphatase-like PHP family hydrolase